MIYREVNASDARQMAEHYGFVVSMDEREDGGWNILTETEDGDMIFGVAYDECGELRIFA